MLAGDDPPDIRGCFFLKDPWTRRPAFIMKSTISRPNFDNEPHEVCTISVKKERKHAQLHLDFLNLRHDISWICLIRDWIAYNVFYYVII